MAIKSILSSSILSKFLASPTKVFIQVLGFISKVLCTNSIKERDLFVELSPHGIHVGCKYAFGPLDIEDIKKES